MVRPLLQVLVLVIAFCPSLIGQSVYPCFSSKGNGYKLFGPKGMEAELAYQAYVKERSGLRDSETLTIPVVFHVVSGIGEVSTIDIAIVEGFVEDINRLLGGEDVCGGGQEGLSTNIELCLAKRTMDNEWSEGVYHYNDELSELDACTEDNRLKRIPSENGNDLPSRFYLNVFVVNRICAPCQSIGCSVGGYSSYAPAHGSASDGIVIERGIIENSDCHQRKVFLHELGHYLNLLHTFEGGCKNDDCLSDGDRVCDTPPSQVAQIVGVHPCTTGEEVNSCNTDVNPGDENNPFTEDQEDLLDNYMSYSPVSCMRSFTLGQRLRMRSALLGPRSSLLRSNGCLEPCTEVVNWSIDIPENIYAGEATTILNESNAVYNYTWEVGGIKYNMHDLDIMFDTSGFYSIVIYPNDANLECSDTIQVDVEVSCNAPDISFTIEIEDYEVGEEVRLAIPMADEQYTYIWHINGSEVGAGQEVLYTIPEEGLYTIYVKTCNSYCCRRSSVQKVQIGPCQTGQKGREWHLGTNLGVIFEEDGSKSIFESSMYTFEPAVLAYDDDGTVLFYSNGDNVWNIEGEIMSNGQWLAGWTTTSSQALTLRHPGNENLWYLFHPDGTIPRDTDLNYVVYYSIIDMSQEGGLGRVVERDIELFSPTTEKVTAVRHCNGKDWWVIMHELGTANFRVYTIDQNGLNTIPSVQSIGSIHPYTRNSVQGKIKPNNEGTIIAVSRVGTIGINSNDAHFELFKFDKSTGVISDPLLIFDSLIDSYGITFSNSSEKVYFGSTGTHIVNQLDIREWNADVIRESHYMLDFESTLVGGIAMGPDSIIYISSHDFYFGAVLNPEEDGADVQIIERHIELPYRTGLGTVNFPNDIFDTPRPQIIGEREVCDTTMVVFTIRRDECDEGNYEWIIPEDVEYFRVNGDTLEVVFGQAGDWSIMAEQETGCRTWYDTLNVDVDRCSPCGIEYEIADLDTMVCEGMVSSFRIYSDADEMVLHDVNTGGSRAIANGWVELGVIDEEKCFEIQLIREEVCDTTIQFCFTVLPPLSIDWIVADTVICEDGIVAIDILTSASQVNILDENYDVVYDQPTFPLEGALLNPGECYYLQLQSIEEGCERVVPFCVQQVEEITFEWITADTISCNEDPVELAFSTNASQLNLYDQMGEDRSEYLEGHQIINISEGCYELELQAGECSDRIIFCVTSGSESSIEIEGNEVICPGEEAIYSYTSDAVEVYVVNMGDTTLLTSGTIEVGPLYTDTCLTIQLISEDGCKSLESYCIEVDTETPISYDSINICTGDSIQIEGVWFTPGMTVHQHFDQEEGCDSTHVIHVQAYSEIEYSIELSPSCPEDENGMIEIAGTGLEIVSIDGIELEGTTKDRLPPGRYAIEILDQNGCQYIEEAEVLAYQISWPEINYEAATCEGSDGVIRISESEEVTWYIDGEEVTGTMVSSLTPGAYEVTLMSMEGCHKVLTVEIEISEGIEVSLPEVLTILQGEMVQLEPEVSTEDIVRYEWTPPTWLSCTDCRETVASPEGDIEYTIVVENEDGCEGRASVRIIIEEDVKIYIPNGFSPNGDGLNDTFRPYFGEEGYNLSEMKIYDRWGNIIHVCQGSECAWDGRSRGKELMPGMYIYEIRVEVEGGEEMYMVGEVVLVM